MKAKTCANVHTLISKYTPKSAGKTTRGRKLFRVLSDSTDIHIISDQSIYLWHTVPGAVIIKYRLLPIASIPQGYWVYLLFTHFIDLIWFEHTSILFILITSILL